jgi:hypothetical protein
LLKKLREPLARENPIYPDQDLRTNFIKAVPDLLAKYGDVVASNRAIYLDESLLPAKKTVMKAALKVGWELATSGEQREWIKTGWYLLSNFQPGIGDPPHDGKIPLDASIEDALRINDEFLRVAEMAETEAERDRDEFARYVTSIKAQG